MALTFQKLFPPAQLAVSDALIYTVPASPATNLLRNGRVRLTNTTAVAVAATLNAVPFSGSSSAVNEFLPAVSIAPNNYLDVDIPQMAAGDVLRGFASASASISICAVDGVYQS